MKKQIFAFALCLLSHLAFSQWAPNGNNIYNNNTGNVGIGTSMPTVKLEVNNGNSSLPNFLKVDPLASNLLMSLQSTSINSNATLFDITNKRSAGGTTNGGWAGLSLAYDATAILPETGVNKSSLLLRNDDLYLSSLQFNNSNSAHTIDYLSKLIELDGNTGSKFARTSLSTAHVTHFRWEFDGVEKMRITSSGQVGIGTTLTNNPNGYKLAVNGKIGAKEVLIETTSSTWADYVFEKDYKLMPLKDVESFVKQNKHLPEIPSAEEVKENGHKLGEMDVLLLKKVEEMTLYILEQEKRIQKLEHEIKSLTKK